MDIEVEEKKTTELKRKCGRYLTHLIAETSPYLSLENVVTDGEQVFATCRREQYRYGESGTYSISEVTRVMALQGALAAALKNPAIRKHYYLASKGNFSWSNTSNLLPHSDEFLLISRAVDEISRSGTVNVEVELMTCHGQLYTRLKCRYYVLDEDNFFKAYGKLQSHRTNIKNPYQDPRRLENIAPLKDQSGFEATLGEYKEYEVTGHFDTRPLIPISILGSNLIGLLEEYEDLQGIQAKDLKFWCTRTCEISEKPTLTCRRTNKTDFDLAVLDKERKPFLKAKLSLQSN
ncbi:hypothetical protein [Microbulbifer sp. ARAS458-1]|uniref:hypothetical protein n=1 Tax=Microbulbifer sp. ARAS458-1 TaxID=3140242 RepID=UPI003877C0A3